jgi:hypothetical protein
MRGAVDCPLGDARPEVQNEVAHGLISVQAKRQIARPYSKKEGRHARRGDAPGQDREDAGVDLA